jgi:DNA-binding MarR family transcriptional regulator
MFDIEHKKYDEIGDPVGFGPRLRRREMAVDPKALALLLEQVAREIHNERNLCDLPQAQWAILRYLARTERPARSIADIAGYLGISDTMAGRGILALQRKLLVALSAASNADDLGRIELTVEGKSLLRRDPVNRITTAVERLAPTSRDDLARLMEAFYSGLVEN